MALAAEPLKPFEEYDKRLRAAEMVSPLGSDLFGENVSLYNGATEFAVVDIDLPGNSGLPVQLRRRFKVESRKQADTLGGFGAWDLDVPHIVGTFMNGPGNTAKWDTDQWGQTQRCSSNFLPKAVEPFLRNEIWSGNQMHIPGVGSREVLMIADTGNASPSDGQVYRWSTSDNVRLRCKPNTANGYFGEGFIAVDTNGTTYTFDVGIERNAGEMTKAAFTSSGGNGGIVQAGRTKVYLMASRVEDRHGNWVAYNYTSGRLTSITANDGRRIDLHYSGNNIVRAVAHGREWKYEYLAMQTGVPARNLLGRVELPDQSAWTYAYSDTSGLGILTPDYQATDYDTNDVRCLESIPTIGTFTLTATHPAGTTGNFQFVYNRQYRSGVPHSACVFQHTDIDQGRDYFSLAIADHFDLYSLVSKTLSGPGLTPLQWVYDYGSEVYGRTAAPTPCTSCTQSKQVSVSQPDGSSTRYTFGVLYGLNEGRLLGTDIRAPNGTVLRSTVNTYVSEAEAASMPFPNYHGIGTGSDDPAVVRNRPVRSTTITQQGVTFSSMVDSFDSFARPLNVTRSSTLGYSRSEATEYHDHLATWTLGQLRRLTVNGTEASRTDFNAAVLPWRTYAFGKLQYTLAYNGDGTLRTVTDGRSNTTTLSNWHRGVPRGIAYPDGTTRSAVVNDAGWITRVTDQNGFQTHYTHDAMGRLASVVHPSADSTAWNSTTQAFERIVSTEYGIPAGHWRQTVSTGNARRVTYFDALWRPVITREFDTANATATQRFSGWRYDHEGRVTFAGYPRSTASNIGSFDKGTTTTFDALGRVVQVRQDSEIGVLTTGYTYLSNFRTRITNARGHNTTTSFMAFDQPTTDWPVAIAHPVGVFTDIDRDVFGKPLSLTRRNSSSSVSSTRHYVYDANQQLCKTIEPETGSTVMAYDAAGNLSWSAGGLNLASTTSCNTGNVAAGVKVNRTYDALNRLLTLSFPDGLGNQVWTYTPDGLPAQVTTQNAGGTQSINTYDYNKRRLPTLETLSQTGGPTWTIAYGYTANGHRASITHPSNLTVDYAPNALGQPTRAGTFATGVSYHPNGGLKQFSYGNGLVHTQAQNLRGLPERSRDAYGSSAVYDDNYDYDQNGNVAAISDGLPGQRGNRTMTYDGLDRLTSADSIMFNPASGVPASFTYDVLDNLRRVRVAGRDHTYVYDARQRLERVTNTSGGATVTSLGYDVQGNLASRNGLPFEFDFGNRLRDVVGVESYRYDGHGRRIQATHPSQGTIFSLYGQDGVLRYQRDERVGKSFDHIYLGSRLVGRVDTPIPLSTPSLTAPSYSTSGSYTVQWTASPAATRYELQERKDGGSWSQIQNTAATSRAISGKTTGSYDYRVRACHPTACGSWSALASVAVELPPASPPSLSVPATGPNGAYTVSWGTASGATSYTLEESANGGAWSAVYSGSAQSRAFSGKAAGSYGYRIRACNPAGCSGASTAQTVQVIYPPSTAPSVTAPASSNTGSYSVSWTGVTGATSYQLDERVNSGSWTQLQDAAGTSRSISGKGNGSYGYRTRACNVAGCGPYSSTATVEVTLPPASAPGLTVPSSNGTGSYTVSWTTVATAATYQLQERKDGGSWSTLQNTSATSRALSGKTNGSYDYRVRACNVGGCSVYSTVRTVVVLLPPASAPTLTAPASTTVDNYTVSWTSVATATTYQLQERKDGGSWSTLQNTSATSRALSGKSNGTYSYQVRACNGSGCGSYSAIANVVVNVPQPPATAPSLSVMGLVFEHEPIQPSWSSVSGATSYQLEERYESGNWFQVYNGPGNGTSLSGRGPGNYSYRVRACNGAGCGPYSAIQLTTVQSSGCSWCDPTVASEASKTESTETDEENGQ